MSEPIPANDLIALLRMTEKTCNKRHMLFLARVLISLPTLWDKTTKEYHVPSKRRAAMQQAAARMGVHEDMAKKLITMLRTRYYYHFRAGRFKTPQQVAQAPGWQRLMFKKMEVAAAATEPEQEVPDSTHQESERLMEAFARYISTTGRPLGPGPYPELEEQTGKPSRVLSILWKKIKSLVLEKWETVWAGGDAEACLPAGAALSPAAWRCLDVVLLYELPPTPPYDGRIPHEQLTALCVLYEAAAARAVEGAPKKPLLPGGPGGAWEPPAPAVARRAWGLVHADYLQQGRAQSMIGLQWRWWYLRAAAAAAMLKFWRDANQACTPSKMNKPQSILIAFARRFPHVVTEAPPSWSELVAKGKVYSNEVMYQARTSCAPTLSSMPLLTKDLGTSATPEEADDDIILIEKEIEIIDLVNKSPEKDKTSDNYDQEKDDIFGEDILALDPNQAEVKLIFDSDSDSDESIDENRESMDCKDENIDLHEEPLGVNQESIQKVDSNSNQSKVNDSTPQVKMEEDDQEIEHLRQSIQEEIFKFFTISPNSISKTYVNKNKVVHTEDSVNSMNIEENADIPTISKEIPNTEDSSVLQNENEISNQNETIATSNQHPTDSLTNQINEILRTCPETPMREREKEIDIVNDKEVIITSVEVRKVKSELSKEVIEFRRKLLADMSVNGSDVIQNIDGGRSEVENYAFDPKLMMLPIVQITDLKHNPIWKNNGDSSIDIKLLQKDTSELINSEHLEKENENIKDIENDIKTEENYQIVATENEIIKAGNTHNDGENHDDKDKENNDSSDKANDNVSENVEELKIEPESNEIVIQMSEVIDNAVTAAVNKENEDTNTTDLEKNADENLTVLEQIFNANATDLEKNNETNVTNLEINEIQTELSTQQSEIDTESIQIPITVPKKAKKRKYDDNDLSKNPDFNTELKKLSDEFLEIRRNRKLLAKCTPLTIDLERIIDINLVKIGRVAKRVELPTIEDVRRINSRILTAEVTPMGATSDTETIQHNPMKIVAETENVQNDNSDDDLPREDWEWQPYYTRKKPYGPREKEKADDVLKRCREEPVLPAPSNKPPKTVTVPQRKQPTLSRPELTRILRLINKTKGSNVQHCCMARRHRAVNDARRRIATRQRRRYTGDTPIHRHTGECDCCCVSLLGAGNSREERLQAMTKDLAALLQTPVEEVVSDTETEPPSEPDTPARAPRAPRHRSAARVRPVDPDILKNRHLKRNVENSQTQADLDYQMWIKERNFASQAYGIKPPKPKPLPPPPQVDLNTVTANMYLKPTKTTIVVAISNLPATIDNTQKPIEIINIDDDSNDPPSNDPPSNDPPSNDPPSNEETGLTPTPINSQNTSLLEVDVAKTSGSLPTVIIDPKKKSKSSNNLEKDKSAQPKTSASVKNRNNPNPEVRSIKDLNKFKNNPIKIRVASKSLKEIIDPLKVIRKKTELIGVDGVSEVMRKKTVENIYGGRSDLTEENLAIHEAGFGVEVISDDDEVDAPRAPAPLTVAPASISPEVWLSSSSSPPLPLLQLSDYPVRLGEIAVLATSRRPPSFQKGSPHQNSIWALCPPKHPVMLRLTNMSKPLESAGKTFQLIQEEPAMYAQILFVISKAEEVRDLILEGAKIYIASTLNSSLHPLRITKSRTYKSQSRNRPRMALHCDGNRRALAFLVHLLNKIDEKPAETVEINSDEEATAAPKVQFVQPSAKNELCIFKKPPYQVIKVATTNLVYGYTMNDIESNLEILSRLCKVKKDYDQLKSPLDTVDDTDKVVTIIDESSIGDAAIFNEILEDFERQCIENEAERPEMMIEEKERIERSRKAESLLRPYLLLDERSKDTIEIEQDENDADPIFEEGDKNCEEDNQKTQETKEKGQSEKEQIDPLAQNEENTENEEDFGENNLVMHVNSPEKDSPKDNLEDEGSNENDNVNQDNVDKDKSEVNDGDNSDDNDDESDNLVINEDSQEDCVLGL